MDTEIIIRHKDDLERMLLDGNAEPTYLPLSLLEDITNCFSDAQQIGSGGFEVVYYLDKYITDASCGLEWRKRYKIIKGICEGLLHLHDLCILHLDLKPGNILVDEHMAPKIADFGLSRWLALG
ncbi:hypothetical protein VPH35_114780 [Triticum aestivum]